VDLDRHLEAGEECAAERGVVEAGELEFRLECIGRSNREALRRVAGAHHKLPQILSRTLVLEPHRLVYAFTCDLHVANFDMEIAGSVPMQRLPERTTPYGLSRALLTSFAEEALIALFNPPFNVQSTGTRRFPASQAGDALREHGFEVAGVAFEGLPKRCRIGGPEMTIDMSTPPQAWRLS
jgi:hypothetical protein